MWVVHQVGELVLILTEGSDRQLCGHAGFLQPRVRGYEANFIDADSLRARERGLQLQCQLRGFGFAGGKGVHEPANLFFRYGSEKLYAGQAGGAEQLRELLFRGRSFQGHAIQQKLRIRRPQQQAALRPKRDSCPQLLPSDLELFFGPGMLVPVQAGKLQENVQASYESASCR